ncbi:MAG: alpha-1,2-fucosyltransferase [Acidobacteriota bacterium]
MGSTPVTVVLTDGLGNQMFQYAAARAFAEQRGVPLLIDAESGFRWNIHGRGYELDAFRLTAALGKSNAGRVVHGVIRHVEDAAMRVGRYHLPPLHAWAGRYAANVTGFFQSPAYFEKAAALIRQEFQPRNSPPAGHVAMAEDGHGKETVGIHIRLQHAFSATGEKVTPGLSGPAYEVPIAAYYRSAVEHIQRNVADPQWIVVTDTQPFDPASIGITGPVSIQYPDPNVPAVWDQWLLSQCKHVVIGRSTFSWWAAWLRGPIRGISCAPRIFRPGGGFAQATGIYPPEWQVL